MRPRFARLMWQMTIRLLIGYPRMNRAISEWALGAGSWNVRHPLPSYRAIPQPSRCGPVAPPRRINPAKLKQISVGTLESIPSNSHKSQVLLRSVCDRWQANGHIASPLRDCTVGLEGNLLIDRLWRGQGSFKMLYGQVRIFMKLPQHSFDNLLRMHALVDAHCARRWWIEAIKLPWRGRG
jgi:hypothetical protein